MPNILVSESVEENKFIILICLKKKKTTLKVRPDTEICICSKLSERYKASPSPASTNKYSARELYPACVGMIHFLLPLSFLDKISFPGMKGKEKHVAVMHAVLVL